MKTKHRCPECVTSYALPSQHMKDQHKMKDDKERPLISQKSLHYAGKLRCPIETCKTGKPYIRLDKHHGKKTEKRLTRLMSKAGMREALRSSTPPPTTPPPAPPTSQSGALPPPPPAAGLTCLVNGLQSVKDRLHELLEEVDVLQALTQGLGDPPPAPTPRSPCTPSAAPAKRCSSSPCY